MPRPTPTFTLSVDEAEALQTIMQKNPDGSLAFKRAAVVLACAEGKQGKEIARQYDVTPNRVINWREKIRAGRCRRTDD